MDLWWQTAEDFLQDFSRQRPRLLGVVSQLGRGSVPGVAVQPGVFSEPARPGTQMLKACIDFGTLPDQDLNVVGLAERPVMPCQESLERLLDGLLTMKKSVFRIAPFTPQTAFCPLQILCGFFQPGPGVGDQDRVIPHRSAFLHARS